MFGVVASECCVTRGVSGCWTLFLDAKNGRERPQKLFGRLKAEKVGPLPPVSVIFSPSLFEAEFSIGVSSRQLQRTRVKDLEKTGVQKEFLTFFTSNRL
jgi:hypothetical protein